MSKPTMWKVALRSDQMDCVIDVLEYVIDRHKDRLSDVGPHRIDKFAHRQNIERIHETLEVFKKIGHAAE